MANFNFLWHRTVSLLMWPWLVKMIVRWRLIRWSWYHQVHFPEPTEKKQTSTPTALVCEGGMKTEKKLCFINALKIRIECQLFAWYMPFQHIFSTDMFSLNCIFSNPAPFEILQLKFIPQWLAWYIQYQHIFSIDIYHQNCWLHISNTNLCL